MQGLQNNGVCRTTGDTNQSWSARSRTQRFWAPRRQTWPEASPGGEDHCDETGAWELRCYRCLESSTRGSRRQKISRTLWITQTT